MRKPTRRSACRCIRRPCSTSFRRPRSNSTKRCAPTTRRPPDRLIDDFFLPYLDIRNKKAGYAVSIVKAGATLVGHTAGPVRTPLIDLNPQEMEQLDVLIKSLGPQ